MVLVPLLGDVTGDIIHENDDGHRVHHMTICSCLETMGHTGFKGQGT
jgi:hypothetical protein